MCDSNWILDYFRRSRDHRLLFGGRVNYSRLEPARHGAGNRRRMLRVFPQLRGTRIDYAWGCLLDITLNRAPHFGRLAPDVFFLQGFSGHGIALAGIAGELVAEAVAATAERFDVFARIPHRELPGRRAAAASGAGARDAVVSAARSAVSVTRIAAVGSSSREHGRTEPGDS